MIQPRSICFNLFDVTVRLTCIKLGQRYMYCSAIMGGIVSFISMSDLNNLRKFITTTMYNYVIKEIVELASKSPWVTGKASGIQAGMLGEQGGNSRLGK